MAAYKSLAKIKDLPSVDSVSDERFSGNGIWVYLAKGFINSESGAHCIHEDTVKDLNGELIYIKPCECEECTR